jgi:hypothetical protein
MRYSRFDQRSKADFRQSLYVKYAQTGGSADYSRTSSSRLTALNCRQGHRARHTLAKEIGAKITAVTVTEPFNVFSLAPSELGYTAIEYKKHAEAYAEEVLGAVSAEAIPQVSPATCSTSSTNRFIKQSSMPPRPDGAI